MPLKGSIYTAATCHNRCEPQLIRSAPPPRRRHFNLHLLHACSADMLTSDSPCPADATKPLVLCAAACTHSPCKRVQPQPR
jgi:hypothetical protein